MNKTDFTDQLQAIADKQQATQLAQKHELAEEKRLKQIELGSCDVIPFPKTKREPFRSELTIEQSSVFVANRFKGKSFSRTWTVSNPEDSRETITRTLTVGKVGSKDLPRGVLKQVHQDIFYRLLQLWGKERYRLGTYDGKAYGSFTTSAYRLVMALRGDNSASEYQRVRSLLRDMTSFPIVIENDYSLQNKKDRIEFTLLSDVTWKELSIDKKLGVPKRDGMSEVTVLFSSMVTEGFLDKHIKTLLGEPYRTLGSKTHRQRGELARLLYPYLDAQLATKTNFHIKLQTLAERFGLTQHSKMSYRKRQFTPAINALNGKAIKSEDYVLKVHLRESAEEDDFILVAKLELNKQLRLFKEDN